MLGHIRPVRLLLAFALATSADSQQTGPSQQSVGIVQGRVYCADTGAPARLATVVLEAARDVDSGSTGMQTGSVIQMNSVQTALDGSFSIQRVPSGTYLVFVTLPGYISPFTALKASAHEIRDPDANLKRQLLQNVPRVTVQPHVPATVQVSLERGASIEGTVRFDDGSPAIGITVRPLLHREGAWIPMALNGFAFDTDAVTNDRGEYRFSGLPTGEFVIQADLDVVRTSYEVGRDSGGSSSTTKQYSISIFSGGATQPKNAKPISLKAGDDRPGMDMDVPLSKRHRLKGILVAESDGHTLSGGTVELLNRDDLTPVASVKVTKEESAFVFDYVPEGAYVLSATSPADVRYTERMLPAGSNPSSYDEEKVLHSYQSAKQPIQVDRDTDSVTIVVKEKPGLEQNPH